MSKQWAAVAQTSSTSSIRCAFPRRWCRISTTKELHNIHQGEGCTTLVAAYHLSQLPTCTPCTRLNSSPASLSTEHGYAWNHAQHRRFALNCRCRRDGHPVHVLASYRTPSPFSLPKWVSKTHVRPPARSWTKAAGLARNKHFRQETGGKLSDCRETLLALGSANRSALVANSH